MRNTWGNPKPMIRRTYFLKSIRVYINKITIEAIKNIENDNKKS